MRLGRAKLGVRFALAAAVALAFAAGVVAIFLVSAPGPPLVAELTWFGVYAAAADEVVKDDSSWTGERIVSTGITPPRVDSDRIEIVSGDRFGFGFALSGPPRGSVVRLRWIRLFPPPGAPGSLEGEPRRREEQELAFAIGQKDLFLGYRIDRPEDETPGTWTFQLWDGDRELLEKSFVLAAPTSAKP